MNRKGGQPQGAQTNHKGYSIYQYTNNVPLIVTITFLIMIFACLGKLI